jgi:manganese/zinc/iron transport system permease protein
VLGAYLVLRRMSLLGDAISHSILPGIVIAFLLTGKIASAPLFIGAVLVGILTAYLTEALTSFGNVAEDSSMGVVYTSLFAFGVLLIHWAQGGNIDLDPGCILYGMIEYVTYDTVPWGGYEIPRALGSISISFVATSVFVLLFWKELKVCSFDPALATAMGVNATLVHYLLMGMVAGVTVAAFEAVGSILVIAMLIVPAATAQLLTDRMRPMIVCASAVGALSAIFGYITAVWLDTSIAGMMAVLAGIQFVLAYLFSPRHGVVSHLYHNFRLSLRIVGEDVLAAIYRREETQSPAARSTSWRDCVRDARGGLAAWFVLPRLVHRQLLEKNPEGGYRLTVLGHRVAGSIVRSHRLWEQYLVEHFDLPLDHLHEPASKIEHYIGPDLQKRLADELERPGLDPHGRAIPPAEQ